MPNFWQFSLPKLEIPLCQLNSLSAFDLNLFSFSPDESFEGDRLKTPFCNHLAGLILSLMLLGFGISGAIAGPKQAAPKQAAPIDQEKALLILNPHDALSVRADLFASAQKTITYCVYGFSNDATGLEMLTLLRDARRRGVAVRLIVDYMHNELPVSMMLHLKNEGIEIREYHAPSFMRPRDFGKRMHDKFIEVDTVHSITGDRNVGDIYFGRTASQSMVSRDVYLYDPLHASAAREHADRLWASEEVTPPKLKEVTAYDLNAAKDRLDFARKRLVERKLINNLGSRSDRWLKHAFNVKSTEFFYDNPGLKGKQPGAAERVLEGIRKAKVSLVIENPYIVLSPEFFQELKAASERGVSIEVYTNSRKSLDVPLIQEALEESKRRLAKLGATIWELPGENALIDNMENGVVIDKKKPRLFRSAHSPNFEKRVPKWIRSQDGSSLHAKTMIVDGETSFVMSLNFDPRSHKLNTEVGSIIEGKEFAADLRKGQIETRSKSGYLFFADHGLVLWRDDEGSCLRKVLSVLLRSHF